jgi:Gpi18-like mannosyltransferase
VDAEQAAPAPHGVAARARRARAAARPYRAAILVYLGTRVLLLAVAVFNQATRHHAVLDQLANWDGQWYSAVAEKGYATHVVHIQSTLGFFPLYPLLIRVVGYVFYWPTSHSLLWAITLAGAIVSVLGGLVATVLAQKLATGWWGEDSGRRAAILLCLFPGSVVFSMVYAEGLMIPLAIGTLLALERRRWLLAGILAGLATATEPEAALLIVICAISAIRELRRRGWEVRAAWRSLLAPALSVSGLAAFAAFLWAWTGTPFASLIAQRDGWSEKSDPLAFPHLIGLLGSQVSFSHFNHPTINLNLVVGVIGGILLIAMLMLVYRARRSMSLEAIVWTLGISLVALAATYPFSPNPRVLITAFPAILVVGHYVRGRAWWVLSWASGASLAGMSALTFIGVTLRP